jgi:hypothetical protein
MYVVDFRRRTATKVDERLRQEGTHCRVESSNIMGAIV